ncbi:pentapeptide repeat-containing protein [Micromonospora sp. RTGN7]|uniref:pentapeptide repeat-containing protein n=1 Tax=Micromonospora sp. RTGN7 TaxID=3016526 RepID=UPI0029FEDF86|nr:pentapeptide repeat-containing protein [Micromonospora sp. RTGN7]
MPQELAALRYARHLQPFTGGLAQDEDYTHIHLDGTEHDDAQTSGAQFSESALTGVTFTGGDFRQVRFSDTWIARTRWIGANWAATELLDVTLLDGLLAGVQAYGGSWRRVTLQRCKIDSLNLRGTRLQDVEFRDCDLTETDFSGTTLIGVTFPGSSLHRARFTKVTAKKLDLRGARELDIADGWESLRGAVIDHGQLAQAAPALAHNLGIIVRDQ